MSETEAQWTQKAYAKINLTLDVLGKRADGYHEVSMIMQAVSLHDTVVFHKRKSGISLSCDAPDLPCDSGNLAFRAAELLQQECGVAEGVHIDLVKRIPMAAGLAGGSSDAARYMALAMTAATTGGGILSSSEVMEFSWSQQPMTVDTQWSNAGLLFIHRPAACQSAQ